TEKHKLAVWLDKWQCVPGRLEPQCEVGIRESRYTVVVGSQKALASKWVAWEIAKAKELHPELTKILPLKFEEITFADGLEDLLWVDFRDAGRDEESARMVARLIRSSDAADARQLRGFRAAASGAEAGALPPEPMYGFQGRARELLQLERLFRRHRGVLLHAM